MADSLVQLSSMSLVLVAIVMGLVQLGKIYVDARYAPLMALVLGVAGSFLSPASTVSMTILTGLVIGLTASGLYAGTKTTFAPTSPV